MSGIRYVLWTGCQWKAAHEDWFGVSSSVLHERFRTWQQANQLCIDLCKSPGHILSGANKRVIYGHD